MNQRDSATVPELKRLHGLMDFAAEFFRTWIGSGENGNKGLAYMRSLGFNQAILDSFKVGYSVDCWDFIKKAGRRAEGNYTYSEMEKAGLLNYSPNKEGYYDVFRGRVMVPFLHHKTGQCVGFAGRLVDQRKDMPEDLYPRDISLFKFQDKIKVFNKESFLFGLFQARNEIKRLNEVYVALNYMDVLRLAQLGVTNAISSSGIPFTLKQALLLREYTENVVLIYDCSNPGLQAAKQHVDVFLAANIKIKIVVDEGLKAEQDPLFLKKMLREERLDYVIFRASNLLAGKALDPVALEKGIKSVVRTIGFIPDQILRDIYLGECAKISGVSILSLRYELAKHDIKRRDELDLKKKKSAKPEGFARKSQSAGKIDSLIFAKLNDAPQQELGLIRLLLRHNYKPLGGEYFVDKVLKAIMDIGIVITEPLLLRLSELTVQARGNGTLPSKEYFESQSYTIARVALEILEPSFSISELRPLENGSNNEVSRTVNELKQVLLNAKLLELIEKMADPDINGADLEKYQRAESSYKRALKEHENFSRFKR